MPPASTGSSVASTSVVCRRERSRTPRLHQPLPLPPWPSPRQRPAAQPLPPRLHLHLPLSPWLHLPPLLHRHPPHPLPGSR
jgi:hypothetical protein